MKKVFLMSMVSLATWSCGGGDSEPEDLSWAYQKYGNKCYYTNENDQCNDYTDEEREALRRQDINFDVHCTSLKKIGKKNGKYKVEVCYKPSYLGCAELEDFDIIQK